MADPHVPSLTRSLSSIQRSDQRTNRGGLGFGATDREEQEERDQKGPCYVQRNHGLVRTHWWPPMKRQKTTHNGETRLWPPITAGYCLFQSGKNRRGTFVGMSAPGLPE